ncbi:MAG: ribosome silencing factor [Anaerolineales bacterium]|nr:ribosome silencing factor [Anaerolineales bacterium]
MVNALEDKKGEDILLLDIQELTSFTDYFVICTGTSNRMLQAMADGLIEKTRAEHKKKGRLEGQPDTGWIVVDYGDVVVHLFDPEMRGFYRLEELWREGKILLRLQ